MSLQKLVVIVISLLCILVTILEAQTQFINFDSDRWGIVNGRQVDFLGRKAFIGTAFLNDIQFENGVIEVDVAVTGARSYPGIIFRAWPDGSWERVYIRPHRSGCTTTSLYSDVLQYVASFNRVDSWQLYNGDGYTAGAAIPLNQWFHVKIEVAGSQARVTINEADKPSLQIHSLQNGLRKGGLGLNGPLDGSAYFSNFSYQTDQIPSFDPPPLQEVQPGHFRDWQISQPFKALKIDMEKLPSQQKLEPTWKTITADTTGLVDVSHYYPRSGEPDAVFAKTSISSDQDKLFKLNVGYSDYISIFLNGQFLFSGNSAYQSRDPSFLGIVGFFDTVILPLKKGENELLFTVAEMMGGWGFKAQDGDAVFESAGLTKQWQTPKELSVPESAVYDPATQSIYVSNFEPTVRSTAEGKQYISKLSANGKTEILKWVTGVKNPTGITAYKGKLYVMEAQSLVEIDIAKAQIVARHEVAGAGMLNDVTVDTKGHIYFTDTNKSIIFKFSDGLIEEWLTGAEVVRPNGLCVSGNQLVWGNIGDRTIKTADMKTKQVRTLASFSQGIIDGVSVTPQGTILVSHNEGRLYSITPNGKISKLLDLTVIGTYIADFDYSAEKRMVVMPTFYDNRVVAYQLDPLKE